MGVDVCAASVWITAHWGLIARLLQGMILIRKLSVVSLHYFKPLLLRTGHTGRD